MISKLQIEYNRTQPLGVVGDDPFAFLLLDRLFDDLKIITGGKEHWLEDVPLQAQIADLNLPIGKTEGSSQAEGAGPLLKSKKFGEMVKADPKRKYVLYSPLDPPYKVNPLVYLMNSPTLAHAYENKRYFRDEFSDLIRMAEYEIKYIHELDKAAAYRELHEKYGSFVLQDEESSGSRGTHMVHDYEDFTDAVRALKRFSQGRSVVVSKFIKGETSSIQVCITKYGIFSGGIQRQLIHNKYLCNTKLEGTSKWCGGEVGTEYPEIVQHQAREIASIVGSELASHGYKGIFGVDLIVTPENEIYAIEINARLTGYTHIISDMQVIENKIPFLLLHVLELGNYNYEVTDLDALPSMGKYKRPTSYMIIHNPLDEDFVLKKYIQPGVYRFKDGKIIFQREGVSLKDLSEDGFIITCRYSSGDVIGTGKRILKITKFGRTMSKGELNLKAQELVVAVKKHFNLPK